MQKIKKQSLTLATFFKNKVKSTDFRNNSVHEYNIFLLPHIKKYLIVDKGGLEIFQKNHDPN